MSDGQSIAIIEDDEIFCVGSKKRDIVVISSSDDEEKTDTPRKRKSDEFEDSVVFLKQEFTKKRSSSPKYFTLTESNKENVENRELKIKEERNDFNSAQDDSTIDFEEKEFNNDQEESPNVQERMPSYYIRNFFIILDSVLESNSNLFLNEELELFEYFRNSLSEQVLIFLYF